MSEFHFYKGPIKNTYPAGSITLAELADLIRSDTYREQVETIRAIPTKKAQNQEKIKLDYVTICGTFSPFRETKNLVTHSLLMVLDVDDIPNMESAFFQLKSDPYFRLMFRSPRGNGFKMVVAVDSDKHESYYLDLCLYVKQTYGIELDVSGSDVARACFLSWDPDLFYNPESEVYKLKGLKPAKETPKSRKAEASNSTVTSDTQTHIEAIVQRIEDARIDITSNYDDEWLMIGFSLSTLKENGRDLWHRISQLNPDYDYDECDTKFSEFIQNCRFKTPAIFFTICKKYGIDVSKPGKKSATAIEKPLTIKLVSEVSDNQEVKESKPEKSKKIDYLKFGKVHYKEGGMWVWGTKNWIEIADNFQVFVKYCTEDEKEEKTWILEIRRAENPEPLYVEVTHEEFCSASKLKNKLAGYWLSLKLTDTYLGELWTALFQMQFPMATKVSRFGYHAESGVFFFANKAVNGKVLDPDEFGIVTATRSDGKTFCLSMPQLKKNKVHHFTLTDRQITFNEWFVMFSNAHKYDNAFVPACFYLMALYRDLVVKHTKSSPILYLKGGPSSGKSSIIRSMCILYGYEPPSINLKSKSTEAALVRKMSQASNALIWMDEYFNEFPYEGLLQAAYDNSGYHRATESTGFETDSVDIYSALVLTSNYIPNNHIFFSRCLFVPISDQQKTTQQIEAYSHLREIEKAGFGCITVEMLSHRALIEEHFTTAYGDLYDHLKEAVKHEKRLVERLISNLASALAPAYILQVYEKIGIMETHDPDDVLAEFVAIGARTILRQHQIQSEKTALSEFLEIIQNQYEQGYVVEDVHFRFEGDKIHLRFPSLYTIYSQRYRQTFWKPAADRDTLKTEMVGFEASDKPDEFFKNIRFMPDESDSAENRTRSVSGSCTMTYSKLQEAFGLDLQARKAIDKPR